MEAWLRAAGLGKYVAASIEEEYDRPVEDIAFMSERDMEAWADAVSMKIGSKTSLLVAWRKLSGTSPAAPVTVITEVASLEEVVEPKVDTTAVMAAAMAAQVFQAKANAHKHLVLPKPTGRYPTWWNKHIEAVWTYVAGTDKQVRAEMAVLWKIREACQLSEEKYSHAQKKVEIFKAAKAKAPADRAVKKDLAARALASANNANETAFTALRESVAVLQVIEPGSTVPEVCEGKMDYFVYRSKPNSELRAREKQLKQWREQLFAVVVVVAQKVAAKLQIRTANKVKRTAAGRDKENVKDALRAMLSTVEVWAGIEGDSTQLDAYAKTQDDKPLIASLPHRLKFISAKIKEQIQAKDRPKWGVHFFHGVMHGRPKQSTTGMPGIPFETSSLYKDTTMQAQLGQAKQDETKDVRQQRLVENKMARSLVFHVVLTIDVRPDGEIALNITVDKPRPNAARAQQQSDKIAQLKGAKKKLRAATLDSWVVATAPTSGSVLMLSLFRTIAPSIRVSLLSFPLMGCLL